MPSDTGAVGAGGRTVGTASLAEEEEDAAWVAAAAEATAGDQLDRGACSLRRFLLDKSRAMCAPAQLRRVGDGIQLVEFIFAQALGVQMIGAQPEADEQDQTQKRDDERAAVRACALRGEQSGRNECGSSCRQN